MRNPRFDCFKWNSNCNTALEVLIQTQTAINGALSGDESKSSSLIQPPHRAARRSPGRAFESTRAVYAARSLPHARAGPQNRASGTHAGVDRGDGIVTDGGQDARPSREEQQPINPRMSVVCLLESGRPRVHGGPYMQAEARSIRDAMRMHVENGNHSDWGLPRDTAHVVAVTDDVLQDVERLFFDRIAATDGGRSTAEIQNVNDENIDPEARADALEAQIAVSTDLPNRCEMMDLWEREQCGDDAEVLAVLDSEVEDTPLNVWMCQSCLVQKSGSGVEIIDAPTNSRIRRYDDGE